MNKLTLVFGQKESMLPDGGGKPCGKSAERTFETFRDLSEVAQVAEVMIEKEDDEKEKVLE